MEVGHPVIRGSLFLQVTLVACDIYQGNTSKICEQKERQSKDNNVLPSFSCKYIVLYIAMDPCTSVLSMSG